MEAKLLEIITRLETELAPVAYQAVLGVIRINALWNAIVGVMLLVAWIFVARMILSWWWKRGLDDDGNIVWKRRDGWKHNDYDLDPRSTLTVIGCVALLVVFVIELYTTFNPWTWIAITRPQLELAHQILSHVLK